jgi:hypothetical protein
VGGFLINHFYFPPSQPECQIGRKAAAFQVCERRAAIRERGPKSGLSGLSWVAAIQERVSVQEVGKEASTFGVGAHKARIRSDFGASEI